MKKRTWKMKITMILFSAFMLAAALPFTSHADGDAFVVDKTSLNYSVVQGGGAGSDVFTVTNSGSETLSVTVQITSGGETFKIDGNKSSVSLDIAAGGDSAFTIKASDSKAGSFSGAAKITGGGTTRNVVLKATVTEAKMQLSPSSVSIIKGNSVSFTASAVGFSPTDGTAVEWSLSGATSASTQIASSDSTTTGGNAGCTVDIAAEETAGSLTLKATCAGRTGKAKITLISATNYTLSVTASPEEGGTVSGGGSVAGGDSKTITAKAKTGYKFDGWYLGDTKKSDKASYTVTGIKSNVTYEARFKANTVYIKVKKNIDEAGDVSHSKDVDYGSNVDLKATARTGYKFHGWKEDGKTISHDRKITLYHVTSDRTVKAYFDKVDYTVNITASPANGGTFTGNGVFGINRDINLTATPAPGYKFSAWMNNGALWSSSSAYTIKGLDRDYNLTCVFVPDGTAPVQAQAQNTTPAAATPVKPSGSKSSGGKKTSTSADKSKTDEKENGEQTTESSEAPEVQPSGNTKNSILEALEITEDEARARIKDGRKGELIEKAIEKGVLSVEVDHNMIRSREDNNTSYKDIAGVQNMPTVVKELLDEDELIEVLKGERTRIALTVHNANVSVSDEDRKLFEEYKGNDLEIGYYFEVNLSKEGSDKIKEIHELDQGVILTLDIPEEIRDDSANREYYIIVKHIYSDGTVLLSTLPDEDHDPNTVTFVTDKFSTYAIAYGAPQQHANISGAHNWNYLLYCLIAALVLVNIFLIAHMFVSFGDNRDED